MDRKTFLVGLASMLASLGFSQGDSSPSRPTAEVIAEAKARYEESRRQAIAMNALAGKIHSLADARILVDEVAKIFSKELPPMWVTRAARHRVANAEYQAVTDPAQLIPEQRMADVWNEYIREISAPEDFLVSATEIHHLRDASYASRLLFWERGSQNLWTMPNIYALGPDGKVATGGRALEALRVLYDLSRQPETLRAARERMQRGILVSDSISRYRQAAAAGTVKSKAEARVYAYASVYTNPIEAAERRYTSQYGSDRLVNLAESWFKELFPG